MKSGKRRLNPALYPTRSTTGSRYPNWLKSTRRWWRPLQDSVREAREGVGVLTRRNEGEEEDLRPDVINHSSLQFLPRKRTLEKGIVGYHDARTRLIERLSRVDVKGGTCVEAARVSQLLSLRQESSRRVAIFLAGSRLGVVSTALVVAFPPSKKGVQKQDDSDISLQIPEEMTERFVPWVPAVYEAEN